MYAQLIKALDDIRASYWFIPLCMLLTAILLALFTRWLDKHSYIDHMVYTASIVASGATDARTILSVIATSVMGVAGVTFSITIVAVSFASANFGPRLISNFMRDRGNQFTLGTFVGTFAFCLIILATVHGRSVAESGDTVGSFVPYISVIIAIGLALGCIVVLIYYIHHIAETINIENIIADIGDRLQRRIVEIYPDSLADDALIDAACFNDAIGGLSAIQVCCDSIGYVQAIDHDRLVELTQSNDLLTRVHYRPGDFVTPHDSLLSVWCQNQDDVPVDELKRCFATGPQRTEHQNVLFLVEQLAEIIGRALSPGVNDPFTAVSCLNWYRMVLLEYVKANPEVGDDQLHGTQRVQVTPVTFDRLTSVMFDSVRQYIVTDLNALLHCLAIMTECAWHAGSGVYRQTLEDQLKRFYQAGLQANPGVVDSGEITQRYKQSRQIIEKNEPYPSEQYELFWFGGSA